MSQNLDISLLFRRNKSVKMGIFITIFLRKLNMYLRAKKFFFSYIKVTWKWNATLVLYAVSFFLLTPNLGEKHAVPHNMHPQARLSEFDETWHIYSLWPFYRKWSTFLIWAFTSALRAPPRAEASFYSLQGKLLCNFAHFYLPFISKVNYKWYLCC